MNMWKLDMTIGIDLFIAYSQRKLYKFKDQWQNKILWLVTCVAEHLDVGPLEFGIINIETCLIYATNIENSHQSQLYST